jgi:hypothetical protein
MRANGLEKWVIGICNQTKKICEEENAGFTQNGSPEVGRCPDGLGWPLLFLPRNTTGDSGAFKTGG